MSDSKLSGSDIFAGAVFFLAIIMLGAYRSAVIRAGCQLEGYVSWFDVGVYLCLLVLLGMKGWDRVRG